MPGITVLPSSQALPAMQNGPASSQRDIIVDIKESAKRQANDVRGASAISLLVAARKQALEAQALQGEGDLRGSLSAFTKAASLMAMFINSAELKQEGLKGVLAKELTDFQQREGRDLVPRMQDVEAKLIEAEKFSAQSTRVEDEADGPIRKSGGSIADRMRLLQDAGLAVSTTKRLSREIPTSATPMSPDPVRPNANRISLQNLSLLSPPTPMSPTVLATPITASSTISSPHALVPTSSFGPPSPTSSASSSPHMSHLTFSDFTHNFPSIDELDEMMPIAVPAGSSASRSSKLSAANDGMEMNGFSTTPSAFAKTFPILPMDHAPRPSSTPIPPTMDAFVSRPASPARQPMSPTVPRKPSGLSLNAMSLSSSPSKASALPLSSSSRMPSLSPQTPAEKPELPFTSLFPRTLFEWMNKSNFKVLVIDVRTRAEFEREHIKADGIICIEPSVLQRDNVNPQMLEDALVVGPQQEWALFFNREKFDLIAIYDEASDRVGDSRSPTSCLIRAIYETEFRKVLKNIPMLLVGGLQAWKREFGEAEVVHGSTEANEPKTPLNFLNGASSSRMNGISSPSTPRTEVTSSLTGHSRSPAEISMSALSQTPSNSSSNSTNRSWSGAESPPEYTAHRPWLPTHPTLRYSLDQIPGASRSGLDLNGNAFSPNPDASQRLARKPGTSRSTPNSTGPTYSPTIPENSATQHASPIMANGSSPIQYPQFNRTISPQVSGSSFTSSPRTNGLVSVPPQASINPSPLSRRRSEYIDQSQEAVSSLTSRPAIDYPELSAQHILRPPPAAASSGMERQDNRPRLMQQSQAYAMSQAGPKPPTIQSDYPVTYWPDVQIGTSGLKNLGNTCYMNSTIQCLSATVPFARFFTDGRWKGAVNMVNSMGTRGQLAAAFAIIIRDMWQGEMAYLSPVPFRRAICSWASQFSGNEQHDSQEFLTSLLDGLHEDLNRVLHKPSNAATPEREAELEKLPVQIASEQEWEIYRMRNDSLVVDFFQGQFRNKLECQTCHKTSTTYNTFMYLTLPIPAIRSTAKVSLHHCLDAFVKEEVMEKSEAWHCPHCKTLRKATKQLSLSRMPPVLLIHLKRFSVKGHFTDKMETFVDFPLKNLDLTNYMPPPLPPGINGGPRISTDDPRTQLPPYKYDLYAVTNHFGTLSSGHYTAFIASRGGWLYCDDSRVTQADPKDIVGKPAYILFYKRTKA